LAIFLKPLGRTRRSGLGNSTAARAVFEYLVLSPDPIENSGVVRAVCRRTAGQCLGGCLERASCAVRKTVVTAVRPVGVDRRWIFLHGDDLFSLIDPGLYRIIDLIVPKIFVVDVRPPNLDHRVLLGLA